MDLQLESERYTPPPVGVGEPVLVKLRNRNCFVAGYVQPPQNVAWKPGDPLGKRITVFVPVMGRIIEDIVHINDPLHRNNYEVYHTAWEVCNPGRTQNVHGTIIELEGRIVRVASELEEANKRIRVQEQEISKLKAAASFKTSKKDKEAELAVA